MRGLYRKNCGKIRYRTKLDAQLALLSTQRNGFRSEKRVYYHTRCKGWHLTSQRMVDWSERNQKG